MAISAAAGHRVILVCATRGEQGEPQEGILADGEQLWERRVVELQESCEVLGAEPPHFLGYEDSGMIGEPENDNPNCFWQADHNEASARLAGILRDVKADVLTIYDSHGGYGHPDHLRVHTVGLEAAKLAGTAHVYEATTNRDRVQEMMAMANDPDSGVNIDDDFDTESFGTASKDISFELDVRVAIAKKRDAITAHRSQVGPDSFFLQLPEELFVEAFGYEWFNVPATTDTGGAVRVTALPGLA